jgi:hypothetical protein
VFLVRFSAPLSEVSWVNEGLVSEPAKQQNHKSPSAKLLCNVNKQINQLPTQLTRTVVDATGI